MFTISTYNKNIKVRNIKALTTIWLPFFSNSNKKKNIQF